MGGMLSCVEWLGGGWLGGTPATPPSLRGALATKFSPLLRGVWSPAPLAMTGHTPSHSRDAIAPEGCYRISPSKQRAQGMPVRAAPAVSCANCAKKAAHEHTGQRRASDIPRAMALRLMACSPRSGRARCHRGPRNFRFPELDASIRGKSGPHAFTVRLCRLVRRNIGVHRIPPHVRDDRDTPLVKG